MINLSEQQALEHIVNYGYYIADAFRCESEEELNKKYMLNKIYSLGDVSGKAVRIKFCEKADGHNSFVHYINIMIISCYIIIKRR